MSDPVGEVIAQIFVSHESHIGSLHVFVASFLEVFHCGFMSTRLGLFDHNPIAPLFRVLQFSYWRDQ
jgi:hypothetical protein